MMSFLSYSAMVVTLILQGIFMWRIDSEKGRDRAEFFALVITIGVIALYGYVHQVLLGDPDLRFGKYLYLLYFGNLVTYNSLAFAGQKPANTFTRWHLFSFLFVVGTVGIVYYLARNSL